MCGGVRQRRLAITDLRVDLGAEADADEAFPGAGAGNRRASIIGEGAGADDRRVANPSRMLVGQSAGAGGRGEMAARVAGDRTDCAEGGVVVERSEEHTSELQSLMRISYADFCLKKKTYN